MKEWLLRYWLEVIFGIIIAGLGCCFKALQSKFKGANAEQEAIKLGIQALLRDRIIQSYNKHIEIGYMPIYALENVEAMYVQYHNLGGNGTITKLMTTIRDLPTEKKGERNEEVYC